MFPSLKSGMASFVDFVGSDLGSTRRRKDRLGNRSRKPFTAVLHGEITGASVPGETRRADEADEFAGFGMNDMAVAHDIGLRATSQVPDTDPRSSGQVRSSVDHVKNAGAVDVAKVGADPYGVTPGLGVTELVGECVALHATGTGVSETV